MNLRGSFQAQMVKILFLEPFLLLWRGQFKLVKVQGGQLVVSTGRFAKVSPCPGNRPLAELLLVGVHDHLLNQVDLDKETLIWQFIDP